MDVIARRAFERPDVEAHRAGCNPRQHRSCLAGGANWSPDGHDASPLVRAGALKNSQSPVDTEGAVMDQRGTSEVLPLFHFAHFRKVNVLVEAKSN
jgi:hypothetical protein